MASEPWRVFCDGSAYPNPGNMGLGATFTAPDGAQHTLSVAAPGKGCNNEAEARAMMAALAHAKQLGAQVLVVHSDSRVVVDQIVGAGVKPIARLEGLFDELRAMLASFGEVSVVWIPGHRNNEADALARAAAGLSPKKPKKHKKHKKPKKRF